MTLSVRTREVPRGRPGGTKVLCPTCGRLNGLAFEPGGRIELICLRCRLCFEAVIEAVPIAGNRVRAESPANPVSNPIVTQARIR